MMLRIAGRRNSSAGCAVEERQSVVVEFEPHGFADAEILVGRYSRLDQSFTHLHGDDLVGPVILAAKDSAAQRGYIAETYIFGPHSKREFAFRKVEMDFRHRNIHAIDDNGSRAFL
jgi:hypothetical protein